MCSTKKRKKEKRKEKEGKNVGNNQTCHLFMDAIRFQMNTHHEKRKIRCYTLSKNC